MILPTRRESALRRFPQTGFDSPSSVPAPFHRVAELWFEDRAALDAAIDSPELALAAEDAAEMEERFGVTLYSPAGSTVDAELGPYSGPR